MESVKNIFFGPDPQSQKENAEKFAKKVFPDGAELKCGGCWKVEEVSADNVAGYLLKAPVCCGVRMDVQPRRAAQGFRVT